MTNKFTIEKADEDQHLVFGWASVANTADGKTVTDYEGDVIEPEELEKAAYTHVLEFRSTGEKHDPTLRNKGRLVESCVFTEEKQRAIGIPSGIVPVGWWVGYKIEDDAAWQKIKNGDYQMFSVEGTATREAITKGGDYPRTFGELWGNRYGG